MRPSRNRGAIDSDPGWINRRFAALERAVRESNAAKRLQAATIGKGGLTVKGGGGITVKDAGHITTTYPTSGADAVECGDITDVGGHTYQGIIHHTPTGNVTFAAVAGESPGAPNNDGAVQFGDVFNSVQPKVNIYGSEVDVHSTADVTIGGEAGATSIGIRPAGLFLNLDSANPHLMVPGFSGGWGGSTTSAAANMVADGTSGEILRSTSSLRYKQDVADAEVDPAAVLQMRGRTWRDKAEVEQDPGTERRHVGFIAEELDEIGLGQFVVYDEQGRPDAISYDRLSVALLAVVKDLAARVEALEQRD